MQKGNINIKYQYQNFYLLQCYANTMQLYFSQKYSSTTDIVNKSNAIKKHNIFICPAYHKRNACCAKRLRSLAIFSDDCAEDMSPSWVLIQLQ